MAGPSVREATERDARRIAQVPIAAWQQAYLDLAPWTERRRGQIASPRMGVRFRVATLGPPEPCGFAVAGPTRDDPPPAAGLGESP